MKEKIKIIHDALKALEFDVIYNNDNDILETLFTTCGRMEYMIEYNNDKDKYLIVGELKGARFTDCWIADDALAVIGRINKNKMVEDYFLYCEKSE